MSNAQGVKKVVKAYIKKVERRGEFSPFQVNTLAWMLTVQVGFLIPAEDLA